MMSINEFLMLLYKTGKYNGERLSFQENLREKKMPQYTGDTRAHILSALNEYLADTAVVYFKTHVFHWNVEGPNFYALHLMFEKLYTKLWKSTDEIAERIRTLGEKTPTNYRELLQHSSIEESETLPASHIMVQILKDDYLALAKKARNVGSLAEIHGDRVTTDMMTKQAAFLEKSAWMLLSAAMR